MPSIEVEGKKIELSDDGYLANYDDWNEKVACAIADREGVSKTCPLTPEKIEILKWYMDSFPKLAKDLFGFQSKTDVISDDLAKPIAEFLEILKLSIQ